MIDLEELERMAARPGAGEALARVKAENEFVRRHKDEYRTLLAKGDHVKAILTMVKRHSAEYGRLVKHARGVAGDAEAA